MVDWLARAGQLSPLLAAAAPRIEAQRRLPADVLSALHDSGLFRLLLPRALGGAEVDPALFSQVTELLAQADASTAWCVCQACGCSMSAAYLPPAVAAQVFAPGSTMAWGPGTGRADMVDGGYRITGRWAYASGGHHATWLGGRCQLVTQDGAPAARTMVFPAAAARWSDDWHAIGLKGTGSDGYAVTDLFVPDAFSFATDYTLVPDAEKDERHERGRLYGFPAQSVFAAGFAGVALGLARAVLNQFLEVARSKTPRGSTALLREDATVQLQFGRAEVRLRAARAFLQQALHEAWAAAVPPRPLTLDERVALRMAITHAILEAKDALDAVYHAVGASAVFEAQPFERRFRDMHSGVQHLQGRLQHFATIGRHLFGLEIDSTFV